MLSAFVMNFPFGMGIISLFLIDFSLSIRATAKQLPVSEKKIFLKSFSTICQYYFNRSVVIDNILIFITFLIYYEITLISFHLCTTALKRNELRSTKGLIPICKAK